MQQQFMQAQRQREAYQGFVQQLNDQRQTHDMRAYDRAGIEGRELITGPYHEGNLMRKQQMAAKEAAVAPPVANPATIPPASLTPTRASGIGRRAPPTQNRPAARQDRPLKKRREDPDEGVSV